MAKIWRRMTTEQRAIVLLIPFGFVVALLLVAPPSTMTQPIAHIPKLDILDTIPKDASFRISRKLRGSHDWDGGNAYPTASALVIINAINGASPWELERRSVTDSAAFAIPPPAEILLAWYDKPANLQARNQQSISIFFGNRLFGCGDHIYRVPEWSEGFFDQTFPENKLHDD